MRAHEAENLRILIRHMETKVSRTLAMHRYFFSCGTPACAYGEACMVPEFRAQGLHEGFFGLPSITDRALLFGEEAHYRLFGAAPISHPFGFTTTNAWGRNDVTPQEWAAEARLLLAEHGYRMEDPIDEQAAKAFVERVTAPRAAQLEPECS